LIRWTALLYFVARRVEPFDRNGQPDSTSLEAGRGADTSLTRAEARQHSTHSSEGVTESQHSGGILQQERDT
jgi:hypothetical protein